jgi:hypothetical protein
MTLIAVQRSEIFEVAGVGQLVEVEHRLVAFAQPAENEIGADEARTAGHKNHEKLPLRFVRDIDRASAAGSIPYNAVFRQTPILTADAHTSGQNLVAR